MTLAKSILTLIGSFCFHFVAFVTLLAFSPVLYVIMILDRKRLKRSAMAIEPLPDDAPRGGIIDWIVRNVLRPVIITLVLPLIVLWGGFLCLFFSDSEEDDVIW